VIEFRFGPNQEFEVKAIGDVNGDGRPDLACLGKSGLFLFTNRGK